MCPDAAFLIWQVEYYLKKLVSRSGSTDNHATSGLKFRILAEQLSIGVSVLLTDVRARPDP